MGRNFWNLARVTGVCMVKRNIETVLFAFILVGSSIKVEKDVRYHHTMAARYGKIRAHQHAVRDKVVLNLGLI